MIKKLNYHYNKYVSILLFLFIYLLNACNIAKEDRIVGVWELANFEHANEADMVFPDTVEVPVFGGRCSTRPDFCQFMADGFFVKTTIGSDCADSVTQTGIWELNKNKLTIFMDYGDFVLNARIIKLTEDRLIYETKMASNFNMNWIFWRKE